MSNLQYIGIIAGIFASTSLAIYATLDKCPKGWLHDYVDHEKLEKYTLVKCTKCAHETQQYEDDDIVADDGDWCSYMD